MNSEKSAESRGFLGIGNRRFKLRRSADPGRVRISFVFWNKILKRFDNNRLNFLFLSVRIARRTGVLLLIYGLCENLPAFLKVKENSLGGLVLFIHFGFYSEKVTSFF